MRAIVPRRPSPQQGRRCHCKNSRAPHQTTASGFFWPRRDCALHCRCRRYLTLDDYILGYLDGCVAEIVRRTGVDKVNLLGVCEVGVFDIIEVGGTYGWVASANIHNL